MTKPRLLFIDILKTVGVISVVYWHLFYRDQYLGADIPFYGLIRLGGFGVLLFLFASGLSLSIKDYNFSTKKEILDFYYKRLIRIYPAMWLSILIALVLMPTYLNNLNILKLVEEFTGFYYYFQGDFPDINSPLWYIGLIIGLYLLFPLLDNVIKKYKFTAFALIFFVSFGSLLYLRPLDPIFGYNNYWYCGVLPNLWIFVLGMYIGIKKLYPKWESKNILIKEISDISFYAYLLHPALLQYAENMPLFLGILIISSHVFMIVDEKIIKPTLTKYIYPIPSTS